MLASGASSSAAALIKLGAVAVAESEVRLFGMVNLFVLYVCGCAVIALNRTPLFVVAKLIKLGAVAVAESEVR